jgi:thioredoxin:protein disulfide reductase
MNPRLIIIAALVLLPGSAIIGEDAILARKAFTQPEFLPVDEAYMLTAVKDGDTVQLHWLMRPGYYLYRDRLSFSGTEEAPELPVGKRKFDEIFGDVEVYYNELLISIKVSGSSARDGSITVGYQGCADAGLCYPPQKRMFILDNL